jgi:hypothetical protein
MQSTPLRDDLREIVVKPFEKDPHLPSVHATKSQTAHDTDDLRAVDRDLEAGSPRCRGVVDRNEREDNSDREKENERLVRCT